MCATVFWSFGSWSTPRLPLPKDAFVLTVYEMLCGSVWLLLFASVRGEHVLPTSAPLDAWLAWAYLVTFGSVVAFTAYVWVLSVAPISLVATYAYVNPVVAVFLGWLILSEAVTLPILVGGLVVVGAVAIVVSAERQQNRAAAVVAGLRLAAGLPDAHPVDVHVLGELSVLDLGKLVVGGQQAQDEVLGDLGDAAADAPGLLAVDAEDQRPRRPLHGEDVEVLPPAVARAVEERVGDVGAGLDDAASLVAVDVAEEAAAVGLRRRTR